MTAIWTTKEGDKIPVTKMSDSHLINSINLLLRIGEARRQSILDDPPFFQGEMAQVCADAEYNAAHTNTAEDYTPEIYYDLVEEAGRRGLDL